MHASLTSLAIDVCESDLLNVDDKMNVCPAMVTMMANPVLDMLANGVLTQVRVCNELLGFCNKPSIETLEVSDFQTRVLADKPAEIQNDDYINKMYESVYNDPNRASRETLQILHISDIHVDMLYKNGSNADCDGYLCCREENGMPTDPSKQAGPWGAYKCDLPLQTYQNMLNYIKESHQ